MDDGELAADVAMADESSIESRTAEAITVWHVWQGHRYT
jgi:hypothetical protein